VNEEAKAHWGAIAPREREKSYSFQSAGMGLASNVVLVLLEGSCNVVSHYFERLAATRR